MSGEADAAERLLPRENPELLGHEAAESLLRGALEGGRLAHAWMFCGPRGIGKATLAHRFARYVLAHGAQVRAAAPLIDAGPSLFGDDLPAAPPPVPAAEGGEGEGLYLPPGHPVFQRAAAGSHSDLMVVERAVDEKTGRRKGVISVDSVREVKGFLRLTAGEGAWRVVIVDAADDMNRNAANALLKVLEEPPPGALILLVCHNPGRLLPTIRSRCRALTLRPPAMETVAVLVRARCPDLDAEAARRLAEMAEGSVGHALDLAAAGGVGLLDEVSGLLARLPTGLPAPELHDFAGRFGGAGKEAEFEVLRDVLRWWLERLIVVAAGGPVPRLLDAGVVEKLASLAGLDRWMEVWEKVTRLLASATTANLDRKQVVLTAFIAAEAAVRK